MSNDRPTKESRSLFEAPLVRTEQGELFMTGYALRFNSRSEPLTDKRGASFVETIAPEALARLGERRDVKFAIGHDLTKVYGSTRAGTLRLDVDAIGLRFTLGGAPGVALRS